MAVKRFEKIRQTRYSIDEVTQDIDITETYIAVLDNPREPRIQMMLERPDLARFQPHPDEPSARVISFEFNQRKHSLIYDVVVRWASNIKVPVNPYDEPAEVTVETVDTTVPFLFDHEGRPNVNTAGDFLEGAEDVDPMLVFNITKKISPYYPTWLLSYGQSLNSDSVSFRGITFSPKQLKVASLRIGSEQEQDKTPFLPLQLQIIGNPNGWEQEFLNRGTQEIVIIKKYLKNGKHTFVSAKAPITDDTGKPVSSPQFLDEDGRRPRLDSSGKRISLEDELKLLNRLKPDEDVRHSDVKRPLEPSDIITLKRTRKKPRPFNGVLPLT